MFYFNQLFKIFFFKPPAFKSKIKLNCIHMAILLLIISFFRQKQLLNFRRHLWGSLEKQVLGKCALRIMSRCIIETQSFQFFCTQSTAIRCSVEKSVTCYNFLGRGGLFFWNLFLDKYKSTTSYNFACVKQISQVLVNCISTQFTLYRTLANVWRVLTKIICIQPVQVRPDTWWPKTLYDL